MTVMELEPKRVLSPREQKWADFVGGLEPWEVHKLHIVGELDQHDRWLDGKIDLMTVYGELQDKCGCSRCSNQGGKKGA